LFFVFVEFAQEHFRVLRIALTGRLEIGRNVPSRGVYALSSLHSPAVARPLRVFSVASIGEPIQLRDRTVAQPAIGVGEFIDRRTRGWLLFL
jgi:hypothetical protein